MGSLVDEETIAAHIDLMVESQELRAVLRNRALHETGGRRNSKIMERILGRIGWH
jgi:hypothetical protein